MTDQPAADIVGSYYGEVAGVKISKDGTEVSLTVSCDIANTPGTAEWIREVIQNPCSVVIGKYDGLKDIGRAKRPVGRPAMVTYRCQECGEAVRGKTNISTICTCGGVMA